MRVLIAFDKFKDALSAAEACETVRAALVTARPEVTLDVCPLTDGGEGFVEVLTDALNGERMIVHVAGPRGEPVDARIGLVNTSAIPAAARALLQLPVADSIDSSFARLAVIEMASASGLALLPPHLRDPWETSSIGTGQMIRAAAGGLRGTGVSPVGSSGASIVDHHGRGARVTSDKETGHGASAILLGIGGSATNDLGTGALSELGLQFLDAHGRIVSPIVPKDWSRVVGVTGELAALPTIRIACDVTNPLLGPQGASAVYGPQKGLRADDLPRMENEIGRMAALLQQHYGAPADLAMMPGAGAAGGIAFGLAAAANAKLVNGFELISAWCDLDARMAAADVVLTGEGRFDATSLQGKGPGAIASRAAQLGKRVHVFAGSVRAPSCAGVGFHQITPEGMPLALALERTRENLSAAVRSVFGHT